MKICIEGNIGSGKSTLITRLCQEKRMPVFLEPVDEWKEWLSLFYTNPERWGMAFNLQVLLTFNQWKDNVFPAIYERSPISNRYVFTQIGFEEGRLNKLELNLFHTMYTKLGWKPNVIIYVRTSPEVSLQRMQKRARSCESTVPLEYLTAIHNKHDELFHNKKHYNDDSDCVVFEIDGNKSANEVYIEAVRILQILNM